MYKRQVLGVLLGSLIQVLIPRDWLLRTLGLFDYLADLFGFDDSALGRFKTALLTFVPVSYTHLRVSTPSRSARTRSKT